MKLVIDIPEKLYAKVPTLVNKGSMWIGDVLEAVKNGTPLEAQPTDAVWRSDVEYIIKGSLCDLRRNEDKRIFINTLNSLPSVIPQKMQGKWIPTTERLPDNNQTEYLVTYKRKGKLWINIGFCDDGDWYLYSNDEGPNWEPYVIAWMPLPEPYKREDDEE